MVGQRWIRKTECLGNFKIKPHDMRFYALYEGEELICVTVYKIGAIAVMNRLYNIKNEGGKIVEP
jgi:hypothetical protein